MFFVRRGKDGGIYVEAGEKFHIPKIVLSLDPADGGQFSRPGLIGFIKDLFLGHKIGSKEALVDTFKEIEKQIDAGLMGLNCLSHCDLETSGGVEEAFNILESQGLKEHKFNLLWSMALRNCYSAIEENDAPRAAYAAHLAGIFKEYSLIEYHHLQEIIWLGYDCYVDIVKNEGMTKKAAKERKLIQGAIRKIRSLETEYLYALAKDGSGVASRLTISGISENTLRALIDHELDRREKDREEKSKKDEIKIKKTANSIKLWGFLFTLGNALILAFYIDWIG